MRAKEWRSSTTNDKCVAFSQFKVKLKPVRWIGVRHLDLGVEKSHFLSVQIYGRVLLVSYKCLRILQTSWPMRSLPIVYKDLSQREFLYLRLATSCPYITPVCMVHVWYMYGVKYADLCGSAIHFKSPTVDTNAWCTLCVPGWGRAR